MLAALENGWSHAPVDYQDYENEEQEYADLTADNAIASWSELDLSGINADIGDIGPFDLEFLGLRDFEVTVEDKLDPQSDEDSVPEHVEPRTKLGDIYQLGRHRLMCGDSTSIDAVEKLMAGAKADMVFTDPPYNTGMKAKPDSTRLSHMFDDDFTDEAWESLLTGMAGNYWIASKDVSTFYVCLDWRRSHELVPCFKEAGFKFSNLIVWDKMVHGLGSDYKYTHEFIHVFKKGKPVLVTNQGNEDYQDIWHIQRKMGRDEEHATKKPIELVERALTHASKAGDLVIDLFGGSGSTLIACEKTGRSAYLMELDPKYCDVIVARWENYTGKKAELLSHPAE
jgi:DNA modification methylase